VKRFIVLVITLLVGILSIFGMTFEELYQQNLEESSAYTQAELNLRSAQLEMNKIDNFFVPYLGISVDTMKTGIIPAGTTTVSGLVFGGEGDLKLSDREWVCPECGSIHDRDINAAIDGTKVKAPKVLRKYEKKIKHAQKKLSNKVQGSKNWEKAKLEVARIHEKIKNTREDFLHKLTKEISENQADVFFVETLNIRGMLKNHHLAKSISDSGWYQFKTFLKYKAERLGKKVIEIGMFEPSSKTCSVCGYKNEGLKLSDREWVCPECGTKHDRDVNAAVNIRQCGIKQLVAV